MFSTAIENLVVLHSAARFADTQGYRLAGDEVHLNAAVMVDASAPIGTDWALQLWACQPGGLRGIKVAELPVGCLPTASVASLEGWTAALPPAGQGAHTMVLALASGGAGFFDRIHDLAVFPAPERFCQPSLQGAVGYSFAQAEVEISVEALVNPRDGDNLSGSLSLDLWALPQPYEGGAFEGFLIAEGGLSCLPGQSRLDDVQLTLPLAPLPPGTWHIVLMLREWTPAGYVTRDYVNFSVPQVGAEPAPEVAEPLSAVTDAAPAAIEVETPPEAMPNPAAKRAEAAPVPGAEPGSAGPKTAETGRVSINRASAAELASIKGLNKSVAAAIVAARPYAGLEEVLRAKGMGAKLLEKLRDRLAL
jgi:competence ComEA-like helix-hairpin-helix protein